MAVLLDLLLQLCKYVHFLGGYLLELQFLSIIVKIIELLFIDNFEWFNRIFIQKAYYFGAKFYGMGLF